jgi:hypothetical protein
LSIVLLSRSGVWGAHGTVNGSWCAGFCSRQWRRHFLFGFAEAKLTDDLLLQELLDRLPTTATNSPTK